MKKLMVLPTWLIIRLILPLISKDHPWIENRFTLTQWAEGSTFINDEISLVFWLVIIDIFYLLYLTI